LSGGTKRKRRIKKMKKMKAKEFKEALNKAGFDMDIYGYEGILNMMIVKLDEDALALEAHNCKHAADHARKQAAILYGILDARDYYYNV
jgi:hypothetical protein